MKKLSLYIFLVLIFFLTSPNASEYNIEKKLNNSKYNIVLFEADFNKVCPSPSCALIGRHFIYELVRYPWTFTGNRMRYTAPQRHFKWENLPTDSDAYLFPVMSKKYLKKIGYYK